MKVSNADQQTFWTDQAGPIWVAQMEVMDRALAPVLDLLLHHVAIEPGEQILDIGCGAGSSTFAAAGAAGDAGSALGVDISQTLLASAEARREGDRSARFLLADAQTHHFEPAHFDALISRFGVMFFEEPVVAFVNLASALKPGGRMVLATWGAIGQNPYFIMPAGIAKTVIGTVPKTDPDAPGPFAFRNIERVTGILQNAGLSDITAEEVSLELTPQGDLDTVAALLCEIGPAQSALRHFEADATDRARLIAALKEGLAPFVTPQGIRIPALINIYSARKPA